MCTNDNELEINVIATTAGPAGEGLLPPISYKIIVSAPGWVDGGPCMGASSSCPADVKSDNDAPEASEACCS